MDVRTETAAPDAPPVPSSKSYRIALGWRVFVAIAYSALLCGAAAGIYWILSSSGEMSVARTLLPCLIAAAFAAGTVWQLVIFLTWRVCFTQDAIETTSWWTRRRLRRDEIAGYRINSAGKGGKILLVVPLVANLNAEDLQNSMAAIATNAAFGATPKERLHRLARARKIARVLDILTIAVLAWCFIDPRPYPLLIASLVALPVLALILVALSRGLFRIGVGPTAAHANLGRVCALPAFGIMTRMLFDLNMVYALSLIEAAAVSAAVFVVALAIADRSLRVRPWMLLGIGLVTGVYGFGAIGEANALLDRSPVSMLRSQIIDKHVTSGKATIYYFKLAPWGPRSEPDDVHVPHALYDRLEPGNMACVWLHEGAFGMPWFIVLACR